VTDATGEIPAIGEVEDLDKLDMVGVKDGGEGGVSGEIIADVLEPKCDVIDDVGTFSSKDLLAAATAVWVKCSASDVDIVGGRGTSLSNVLVVQSLETDFLPSTECAGEG